jgi:uncharacterized protein (TIGR03067 family)
MKSGWSILLCCGLVCLSAPRARASDLDDDARALQGAWVSVSFEGNGSVKDSRTVTLNFEGERLLMKVDDKSFKLAYGLDVDSEPKRLDMITMQGGIEVSRNHGIYKLEGDRLTICHGGPVRPEKFEIRTDKFAVDTLIVLKRKR